MAISFLKRSKSAGVTFPPSLGTMRNSAPKASIVSSFSRAKASEESTTNAYFLAAQTMASEEPVLPPVYSTTRMPGRQHRFFARSEEHTSELQSRQYLVCRLLLEKK